MAFYHVHFWRVAAIERRKLELVARLMALDTGARSKGARELWRGVRNATPEMRERYGRICRAVSRYRVRQFFESKGA